MASQTVKRLSQRCYCFATVCRRHVHHQFCSLYHLLSMKEVFVAVVEGDSAGSLTADCYQQPWLWHRQRFATVESPLAFFPSVLLSTLHNTSDAFLPHSSVLFLQASRVKNIKKKLYKNTACASIDFEMN